MFLSGTVLCTINTLVEHGLKNALCLCHVSRHAARAIISPHRHTHARKLYVYTLESFALAELRARPPRRAQSPKFPQHAVWTRFTPSVAPENARPAVLY